MFGYFSIFCGQSKIDNLKDTYRHKGLRKKLIAALKEKGIKDQLVLTAMLAIPRHFFLEKAFEEWAYQDKAFPIGNKQTISQPFTVAYQSQLLAVKKRDKILEIGTGSGYQAAVLAMMGARVYSVERQELLHQRATLLLNKMGLKGIRTYFRDGGNGLPEFAPFEKIIVTAGSKEVPLQLKEQLAIGGHLVIPVGDDQSQRMYRVTRIAEEEFKEEVFDHFRFVPFLKGVNKS